MTTSDGFEVRVDRNEGETVVSAEGDIDMLSGAEFAAALRNAVGDADGRVKVDLTGVTYFGSEGMQALVAAVRLARERDVSVATTGSPVVQRALEVTGLAKLVGA